MTLPADFEGQSLDAPLNDKARKALQDLTRRYQNENLLQHKLKESTKLITETTGTLNDRAHERRVRYNRGVNKQTEKSKEEIENDKQEHEEFQRRADELTKKMDLSMRRIIDNRIWAEELSANVTAVNTNAINSSIRAAAQPEQGENDNDDDDDDDTPAMPAVPQNETPSSFLEAALTTQATRWTSKSLTDRYADDDDYKSFHKTLWDAKHPEENAPLMPAPALWLDREQNSDSIHSLSHPSPSHSVDLAIASERVSLKCPLTLTYFRDPVTAITCNHTFDKPAIENMLKTSTDTVPLTPTQLTHLASLPRNQRTRAENQMKLKRVRCPECNKFFSENDLKPNPVLLRRVQRKIEQERREEERRENEETGENESDDELQGPRGTQRMPVGVGSSPARDGERVRSDRAERIKRERLSGVAAGGDGGSRDGDGDEELPSGTQRITADGATVVSLDDDDDE